MDTINDTNNTNFTNAEKYKTKPSLSKRDGDVDDYFSNRSMAEN